MFDRSPFFRLKSKKKLAQLLQIRLSDLTELLKLQNYKEFLYQKKRKIQEPKTVLKKVHTRIFKLLQKPKDTLLPFYLMSKKGKCYITNAKSHQVNKVIKKLDIKSFYTSTKYGHVYNFFNTYLSCSKDVSSLLAEVCTYSENKERTEKRDQKILNSQFVPTGSPLSQIIAFYAHFRTFESINSLAQKNGLTFTLYVDDLTFSGDCISKEFINEVKKIIGKGGLRTHKQANNITTNKIIITGCEIRNREMYLPKKRSLKVDAMLQKSIRKLSDKNLRKILGSVIEANRVEPNKYSQHCNKYLRLAKKRKIFSKSKSKKGQATP